MRHSTMSLPKRQAPGTHNPRTPTARSRQAERNTGLASFGAANGAAAWHNPGSTPGYGWIQSTAKSNPTAQNPASPEISTTVFRVGLVRRHQVISLHGDRGAFKLRVRGLGLRAIICLPSEAKVSIDCVLWLPSSAPPAPAPGTREKQREMRLTPEPRDNGWLGPSDQPPVRECQGASRTIDHEQSGSLPVFTTEKLPSAPPRAPRIGIGLSMDKSRKTRTYCNHSET